jgi:dienelactone hydrolase
LFPLNKIEPILNRLFVPCILTLIQIAFSSAAAESEYREVEPFDRGPYSVASTNLEIAEQFMELEDDEMHSILLGSNTKDGQARYIKDILKHPKAAWSTEILVPTEDKIYGPASGETLAITTFVVYPSGHKEKHNPYTYPYFDGQFGTFEHMLKVNESPKLSDPGKRYPLIILAHGGSSHGIYDIPHAQLLASHGYIVAVPFYGDDRTATPDDPNIHVGFLRPLITQAVLDSLIESEEFGGNIDTTNIGMSGHSYGGFTALALAGGKIQNSDQSVTDKRIKAAFMAAPWVGNDYEGSEVFAFGHRNQGLKPITIPILCLFGTTDESTPAAYILPATKQLSGSKFVVELVNQPHIFDQGGWQDRNNWELLFFSAYLKNDQKSFEKLRNGSSMKGGSKDKQLFDYQRVVESK